MQLTFIGLIQLAVGTLIILTGPLRHAFAFLMVCGLLGGGAAITLPALGGSSIPPIHFACLFLYLRILAPRGGFLGAIPSALQANRWLVAYTFYAVAAAMIAPRLFAGEMSVAPLRPGSSGGGTVPLGFTSQNITTSVYLLGTLAIALASYIVCKHRRGVGTLVSTGIAIGWLHVFLGIATAVAGGTPLNDFFELFRNGNYAQLDQSFGDFVRIRGLFTESSAFAEFGFAYFVLNAELWYRAIRPRATGCVALALAALLFFSTSSTAYVALGCYLIFFLLRFFAMPNIAPGQRARELSVTLFFLIVLLACAVLAVPMLLIDITDMVQHMTVEKSDSSSAQQRLFWALQGWEAFKTSFGLGVGPGSFRSSSLVMAVIGSTGLIGVLCFGAYAFEVFQPARRSTFVRTADLSHSVGGAFATASLLALLPASVSAPSADFGANFALMAGAALALRPAPGGAGRLGTITARRKRTTANPHGVPAE
jgi:hypothetical protein